jgi:hypothetical protein
MPASCPKEDPVPFRRVWCLFELYTAITLGAKVIMVSGLVRVHGQIDTLIHCFTYYVYIAYPFLSQAFPT